MTLPTAKRMPPLVEAFLRAQPKARIETAQRGDEIILEDDFSDHSMLLLEGWAGFSKMLPDGERQIIDIMLPGDFALIGATHAPVAACTVEALSEIRFINIPPAHVNGAEPETVLLRELFAAEIVKTQSRTSEILLRMGKGSAANRVAYVLLELYIRLQAIAATDGGRFDFPMTQHKLGEFTGMSNVHVCRTMRRFERDGIISYPVSGEICLNDLDELCALAGLDIETLRKEILLQ